MLSLSRLITVWPNWERGEVREPPSQIKQIITLHHNKLTLSESVGGCVRYMCMLMQHAQFVAVSRHNKSDATRHDA